MITAKEIIESIPQRFRKEKAEKFSAVVHLDLEGNEPLQFTISIYEQQCHLQYGLHGTADCTVKCTAENYVALETGQLSPQWALVSGKVKLTDIAVMMQFTKCFKRFEPGKQYTSSSPDNQELFFVNRAKLSGPFQGIRIVDFTRLLPGPLATMFLAQQGAEVIKVEDPDQPDYIRNFEPQCEGTSAFYLALNSCKKSLAINFLSAEGKECLLKLIQTADVVIEQFRPGVMEKFGLHYEALREANPTLIYVSLTGYGIHSEKKNDAGHDLNYIAESGLPFMNGCMPTLPGFQSADVAGGAYMAMLAMATSLFEREKTGKGGFVNVPMTDCILPLIALPLAAQQCKSELISAENFELAGSLPNYQIYACADDKYIALGALEPKFWYNFCDAISKSDWKQKIVAPPHQIRELKKEVAALFRTKTRDEWLKFLKNADCCISPVNDIREVLSSEYFKEQKMFLETPLSSGKKMKVLRHPIQFESSDFSTFWAAPQLGEDTVTILSAIGIEEKKIKELLAKGIVK
jgi:crotonobetainyl-CoA:carnitine CoA-transferase CaiB-like acyl-CoA transferase/putative sterol carrier protein